MDTVSLFTEGDDLYAAMLASIRSARQTVLLETYIFNYDQAGQPFVEALIERARAGLDVRLHVDAFGSLGGLPRRVQRRMQAEGVRVRRFHRWHWRRPWRYNRRDHRKLLVVDNREAYLGGFNIHRESARSCYGESCWRDTHVRLQGRLAQQAAILFELFWQGKRRNAPTLPVVDNAILLSNHNRQARKHLRYVLNAVLDSAQTSLWVTSSYFVPDTGTQRRLMDAARRGVDVRILVPRKTDVRIVRWASHAVYSRLLASGVRIFEFLPRVLHAKTLVVDCHWAMVGTANLDYRSLRHNYELSLLSTNADLCDRLKAIFEEDTRQALEVLPGIWGRRRWHEYLAEAVGRSARRWL